MIQNQKRSWGLSVFFLVILNLSCMVSSAQAQFEKFTDFLEADLLEADSELSLELIVTADVASVTNEKGQVVAGQYRGDVLEYILLEDGKYEILQPHGWVEAKDVLELDTALSSLKGRSRGRSNPTLIINRALVHHALGEHEQALESLDKLLAKSPENIAALLAKGRVLFEAEASSLKAPPEELIKAYSLAPDKIQTLRLLMEAHDELGNHQEVLDLLKETEIPVDDHADLLIEKGIAQVGIKQLEAALKSLSAAIEKGTPRVAARIQRGMVYGLLNDGNNAIADFNAAVKIAPQSFIAYKTRADFYVRYGEYDNAIADYTTAIDLDPEPESTYISRGDLYRKIGQFEQALSDFNSGLELGLNEDETASVYFLRALTNQALEKSDQALEDYAQALKINPTMVGPHRERARLYSQLGQWDKAEQGLKDAVKIEPKDEIAWRFLGDVLRITERYQESVKAYASAIEADPNASKAWNNQASSYESLGQFDQAIKSYKQAIKIAPEDILFHTNLSQLLRNQGDYEAATAQLTEALKLNAQAIPTTRAKLLHQRGDIYRYAGQNKEAIADFDAALKLHDGYAIIYNSRGICHNNVQNYEAAISDYSQAIKRDSENFIFYVNRGDCYKTTGQAQQSFDDYSQAIELNPEYLPAYQQRGRLLVDNAEYEAAIEDLNQVLKIEPENTDVLVDLGDAYRYSKNYEKAIEIFSQLLEKDAESSFSLYARADSYRQLGRSAEAEAGYKAALKLDENSVISWAGLGELSEQDDDFEQAMEFYNKAIKISPKYEWAIYRNGFCLFMLNRNDDCIEAFTQVLELSPAHLNARLFRANAYRDLGEYAKANQDYDQVIKIDNKYHYLYLGRGESWTQQEDYQRAIADYTTAIQLDDPPAGVFNDRARLLASVTDSKVFDPKQALIDAQTACKMTQNSDPLFLDTLAIALAASGRFEEAIQMQQDSIALGEEQQVFSEAHLERAQDRLEMYENNEPYVYAQVSKNAVVSVPGKNASPPSGPFKKTKRGLGGIGSGAGNFFNRSNQKKSKTESPKPKDNPPPAPEA